MAKGQFEKGNAGKPKGAKNKATILGRDIIEEHFIAKGGLKKLLIDIEAMEYEKDRVNAQIKLLEFFIPKQKEIQVNPFEGLEFKIIEDTQDLEDANSAD